MDNSIQIEWAIQPIQLTKGLTVILIVRSKKAVHGVLKKLTLP